MKQFFEIARNTLSISAPANLPAWNELRPRFEVFATTEQTTVLNIDVSVGEIANDGLETIYEPEFNGIGFITGCAMRTARGNIVMQFRHVEEKKIRLRMEMSEDFTATTIVMDSASDKDDHYFLAHAMKLAFMMATIGNNTLLIHSSTIECDGKGYLFQGKSGTGKSTHAGMWLRHIKGAKLLNDDNPFIRFTPDGIATVYGSPWSGKTHCYRNVSMPIGSFVRIVRGTENELKQLSPLAAYASLTTSVYHLPFMTEAQRAARHATLERLVATVPCYEMHCRPDGEAAAVCHRGVTAPCRP